MNKFRKQKVSTFSTIINLTREKRGINWFGFEKIKTNKEKEISD